MNFNRKAAGFWIIKMMPIFRNIFKSKKEHILNMQLNFRCSIQKPNINTFISFRYCDYQDIKFILCLI